MAQKRIKKIALVNCAGGGNLQLNPEPGIDCNIALSKHSAKTNSHGLTKCEWGCIGLGSCVSQCKLKAITINDSGTAEINREKCVGCGLCVKVCPRNIISISTEEYNINPLCSSKYTGATTRNVCDKGCIACGICEKNCPANAISVLDNHAVIDEKRCVSCGMCAVKCPRGTIVDFNGIFTVI